MINLGNEARMKPARERGGQLALALHRRDALGVGVPVAARLDAGVGPILGARSAASRCLDGGRVMTPAPIVFLVDVDR